MQEISKQNIVIAALARDCESQLLKNISRLEKLRTYFEWSFVVVVENDSKDRTKELLNEWQKNNEFVKIISKDFGTVTIPDKDQSNPIPGISLHRIEKMVNYRNYYVDFIKSIDHHIDYLIVVDLDLTYFSVKGILKSIKDASNDWGSLFAYGITRYKLFNILPISKLYYDIYALCEYPLSYPKYFCNQELEVKYKSFQKKIKKEQRYYSVISAFGGIGIYKYSIIKDLEYKVVRDENNPSQAICEHIPFNIEVIKSGYRNYISKELLAVSGKHSIGAILSILLPTSIFNIFIRIKAILLNLRSRSFFIGNPN